MSKSEIAELFSSGKFTPCYPFLTDKSVWNIPGEQYLIGKDNIVEYCEAVTEHFNAVTTHFTTINIIENQTSVAISGTAEFIREGLTFSYVSSCDVYNFDENNNILSVHSYCVTHSLD